MNEPSSEERIVSLLRECIAPADASEEEDGDFGGTAKALWSMEEAVDAGSHAWDERII